MNRFIIATHSTLAEGFANVIRFFNAELEHMWKIRNLKKNLEPVWNP